MPKKEEPQSILHEEDHKDQVEKDRMESIHIEEQHVGTTIDSINHVVTSEDEFQSILDYFENADKE